MVPAAVVDATIAIHRAAARARRHDHRRRQLVLHRRHPARRRARADEDRLRRRRHERRRVGARARLLPDDRRRPMRPCSVSIPIFTDARAGTRRHRRTPGREKVGGTAELGYLHCGPSGAGHFVKMVHNGIEYGIMAAYAEGLGILRSANVGKQTHARRRGDHAAARSRALPVRPQPARHRRGVAARQRDRVVAARPHGVGADQGSGARQFRGPRLRFRRGPLDDQGGHRRGGAGRPCSPRRCTSGSARAARPTSQNKLLSAMRFEFGGHLEKPAEK